jgi:predicted TIM-barrel fold metal-dependent hydrolase
MWSTDFPHNESTYGYTISSLQNVVESVGPAAAKSIVSDNIRRYLGLDDS